ncbi:transglycosylase domain-containing protein [Arthrobacter psychrochitiniphilus]|uniref:Glycosyl transferase n=1 Tax=Arthrobacter psychrochitiniphilus TaxID=291045 RepID=A0A2V3DW37_9MICC|nr:transglycosylase domain-containing protein [Arthrobacter psychrochitiniphilus]NYG15676.1 membrane peptidoglycan carboxypeptidase [Arthrobacter psychrochitiniphilus]PXA66851.1 glycosyl transferase [Arthrobacter psychrochitiniphilus]
MAAKKHPIFDTATTLGKLVLFLGVSTICGVLVAGLMVPAAALASTTTTSSITLFDELPDEMNVGTPAQSSKILASDGSLLATFYDQNRTEVPLEEISPFMKDAIVAVEDARYYEHGGIDTRGLMRAVSSMVQGGGRQGASTITQQFVNNVIIQTYAADGEYDKIKLGADKGVGEKVREIKLAIAIEKKYSKDEILQGYLNWVLYANGNFGIESAAYNYFGIHAKDLNLQQSALLAGVVNSPQIYDPIANPENSLTRRNLVLDHMLDQGMIDAKQHKDAVAAKIDLKLQPQRNGCTSAVRAEYFCEYVSNLFVNDVAYGKTEEDRLKLLLQGGLTIKTTLDPKLQDAAQSQMANFTPMDNNPDKVGQAIVSVQPKTGKILAMAQNTKMAPPEGQWKTDYNFAVDRLDAKGNSLGGSGGFDVGSTIKPFTFAEWLNSGHRTDDTVNASVRRYPQSRPWTNSCGSTGGFYDSSDPQVAEDLQNADGPDGIYYRTYTARQGLALSLNTATMATAAQLDICNIQKMMTATGIHQGEDVTQPYNVSSISALLGSGAVAPLTMANAFATFASGGIYCAPIALLSVTNAKGDKLPVPGANCKQTVKPEVAAGVNMALQQVLAPGGSGYAIPLQYPAGAKTGTTNDSQHTWTTGFTRGVATSSWVGSPELKDQSINGKLIAGQRIPYVDGSTYAGKAWQGYMNQIAGNYDVGAFDPPPASIVYPPAPPPVVEKPKPGQSQNDSDQKSDDKGQQNNGNNKDNNKDKKD